MEKISITVKIPALDNTYEFIVPNNMSIRNAQNLMIRILNSEYGISDKSTDVMLFDMDDNTALRLEWKTWITTLIMTHIAVEMGRY